MKSVYGIVALLVAFVLAASLARAGQSSASYSPVMPTARASVIEPALTGDARGLAPAAADLELTVAPSNPEAIAILVEQHNALHTMLGIAVAPSHPAEIDALLQGYQAME